MPVTNVEWSSVEKQIAQHAFETAYQREIEALIQEVRDRASSLCELEDMWRLHDFLSARRHEIDGKYDNRDTVRIFVCAQLVKEGWLHLNELEGLTPEKLTKVLALTRM
ncbi:MAG: hypothetical protein MUF72_00505 [Elainella sp. Prado103]|jgi:hypothetical protein|nr:hypothetical protein [Elainella sp. Prado103]